MRTSYAVQREGSARRRSRHGSQWVACFGEDSEAEGVGKFGVPLPIHLIERAPLMTPERQLMWAILQQAVRDLCVVQGAAVLSAHNQRRDRAFVGNVKAWFETREEQWPFSFENICGALGLPADGLRRALGDAGVGQRTRFWRRKPPWRGMGAGERSAER